MKKRSSVADLPTGPKDPKSTVLPVEEEAIIVAFRRHPTLTRSALHRCLQRHDLSRLPEVEGETTVKTKFKRYPIGYFHTDIAGVQIAQGKLYLFVAVDRTSAFVDQKPCIQGCGEQEPHYSAGLLETPQRSAATIWPVC